MTSQSTQRPRRLWMKPVVMARSRKRVQHPVALKRPAPKAKSLAEKEAEQWVTERMFERYNQ